jgi:hypothetical protein
MSHNGELAARAPVVNTWSDPGVIEDFRDFVKSAIELVQEESPTRGSQITSSPQAPVQWLFSLWRTFRLRQSVEKRF